mmetsp:Transcript_27936/g.38270  ORF Transcript_27936/g.38270 Transcript_27936/m.38270 type:complete len:223 (+) Transcript_27936:2819-3487(+)
MPGIAQLELELFQQFVHELLSVVLLLCGVHESQVICDGLKEHFGVVVLHLALAQEPQRSLELPQHRFLGLRYRLPLLPLHLRIHSRRHDLGVLWLRCPAHAAFWAREDVVLEGAHEALPGAPDHSLRVLRLASPAVPVLRGLYFRRHGSVQYRLAKTPQAAELLQQRVHVATVSVVVEARPCKSFDVGLGLAEDLFGGSELSVLGKVPEEVSEPHAVAGRVA